MTSSKSLLLLRSKRFDFAEEPLPCTLPRHVQKRPNFRVRLAREYEILLALVEADAVFDLVAAEVAPHDFEDFLPVLWERLERLAIDVFSEHTDRLVRVLPKQRIFEGLNLPTVSKFVRTDLPMDV